MTDEQQEPKIRHRKRLEKIREEAHGRSGVTAGRRHTPSRVKEDGSSVGTGQRTDSSDQSGEGRTGSGEEGTPSIEGTVGGFDSGTRSTITAIGNHYGLPGESGDAEVRQEPATTSTVVTERDMEAERERKRQLAAARQRRKRALEKEAQTESKVARDSDVSDVKIDLKPPFKRGSLENVKVFTDREATEQFDKLVFVYTRGSELLDDVLEIIVKDHEKVHIWGLDEEDARMLATLQMERAKKDKAAARTVRTLISIYDRMYILMLVGPRLVASGQHIKSHGGLSFK